jgi:hypothetical protein
MHGVTSHDAAVPTADLDDDQVLVAEANDGGVRAAVFWSNDRLDSTPLSSRERAKPPHSRAVRFAPIWF